MARWEPDARGRLQKAAMELFRARGYAAATVQEIAAHAGLTERTFFRYFTDKREVLFAGSEVLSQIVEEAIAKTARTMRDLDALEGALAATSELFDARRDAARMRSEVIMADPELRERELTKLMSLATTMAHALERRGTGESAARLAAEVGLALVRASFARWLVDPKARGFGDHVHASFAELRAITGGAEGGKKRAKLRPGP
jgi:AcrR family transcriptional regulator